MSRARGKHVAGQPLARHRTGRHLAPRTRSHSRRGLVVGGLVVLLGAGTVTTGSAYWQDALTSGLASADDGPRPVTMTAATPTGTLYPGGRTALEVTVENPDGLALDLNSLALDTTQGTAGFAVDAAHVGCGLEALSFTTQTNAGAGWTIPASASARLVLPGALTMSPDAVEACQGASFTVYLRAGMVRGETGLTPA